jgi:hypothetical protein
VFIENGQQTQYGGTTGDNGCVEVSDVPFGEYTLGEDLQQGWVNVSGDGDSVVVDEETETFTLVNREGELVDYCDPSQKPNGMSIGEWLAQNDVDGSECFDYEVVQQCGSLDVQFTQNDTPYDYEFRYVLGNQTPALVDWEGDGVLPVNFSEDENGGSVEVTYYVVGPESDYFTGFGIPNIWDGNGETVVVDTDCEGSEGGEQCELVDLTIFSDEDTQVNGVDSVATFTHPAWTASIPGATWIWESFFVDNSTLPQTLTFSRSFNWTGDTNVAGNLDIATDNGYVVRINGTEVVDASGDSHFTLADQDAIDVSSFLLDGANTLEIDVINFEGPEDPEANPAGLLYGLDIEGENCETPEQETGDDDDSGDDDDDDSSTSGGGGSSSRRSSGDDDDDGEVLGATAGEVLQAQTAVLPAGAPATGFGGMSGMAGEGASALGGILSLFGGLALFAGKTKVGGE